MGTIHINAQERPNGLPTVNAGADQSINLPLNSVSLLASGTDPDGVITSVQWLQLSGSPAVIASPTSLGTQVTGLTIGSYTFQVKVTDNRGGYAIDTVQIVVSDFQTLPFMWIGDPNTLQCAKVGVTQNVNISELTLEFTEEFQFFEVQGNGGNTGFQVPTLLRKVSTVEQYPLDVNNIRTSVSGLPQHTKPNVMSDPDYIQPIQNLLDCPVPIATAKRFHTVVQPFLSQVRTLTAAPAGQGFAVITSGLDTNTILENTMNGVAIAMNGIPTRVLTAQDSGLHHIKFNASGTAKIYTDNGAGWRGYLSFFININGTEYPLAPMQEFEFFGQAQYYLLSPANNASHKEDTQDFTLAFDQTINLLAGSYVELYSEISFITTPSGKVGSFRIDNSLMELDIQV